MKLPGRGRKSSTSLSQEEGRRRLSIPSISCVYSKQDKTHCTAHAFFNACAWSPFLHHHHTSMAYHAARAPGACQHRARRILLWHSCMILSRIALAHHVLYISKQRAGALSARCAGSACNGIANGDRRRFARYGASLLYKRRGASREHDGGDARRQYQRNDISLRHSARGYMAAPVFSYVTIFRALVC